MNHQMNNINVAFFGTSDRSIPILDSLKNSKFNLKLCITKSDVTVGREKIIKPTGVKSWAIENGVKFVTIENMDSLGTQKIIDNLISENIEIGLVCDFSFIIPEKIFNFPEHKIINIHFSLLPKYRGASPIQFAVLNQDNLTGITYQLVTEKMDAGDIVFQSELPITGKETSEELNKTLFEKAAYEIEMVLDKYISGEFIPTKQDEENASYTRIDINKKTTLISKEDALVSLKDNPSELDAKIRAFYPWPIAWTHLGEFKNLKPNKERSLKVKLYEADLIENKLIIKKLQVEGKRIMTWEEFQNGYLTASA